MSRFYSYLTLRETWSNLGTSEGFTNNKIEIHGMGGCGQTSIMELYKKSGILYNNTWDTDKKKHIKLEGQCPNTKIMYVYCHPSLSAQSHYRRMFADEQIAKLNNKDHIKSIPKTYKDWKKIVLENETHDSFHFLENMKSWDKCPQILFVTTEDFQDPQRAAKIREFTGVDNTTLPSTWGFGEKQQGRKSVLEPEIMTRTWQEMTDIANRRWK
jgi:hypothetical protein